MQRINLNDQVTRTLGLRLIRGEASPGTMLPKEAELAEEFQVSRSVVREGIRQLVGKGMVEARQRRGTIVLPTENWNWLDSDLLQWMKDGGRIRDCLMDLVEIRVMIEPGAAALAAERASAEDVAGLRDAIEAMAAGARDTGSWLEADVLFHKRLLRASRNVFLGSIMAAMETALRESVSITNRPTHNNVASLKLHEVVVDAIAAKNVEGARKAMTRLLGDARSRLDVALDR